MSFKREKNSNMGRSRNRSRIILMNAAVILAVVIIAMVVQLVNLNRKGKQQNTNEGTKNTQVGAVTPEPTSVPSATPEIETRKAIRENLDVTKPMVALTFDDGPYDAVTNRIVKVLAKHDARATFFVVGNRVKQYKDTLKNSYNQGNQIATHTYDHGDLSKMKKAGIEREINKSVNAIKKITGEAPKLLRPPYGSVNKKMRKLVGMPMIYWNVDSEDWKSRNKKNILKRCSNIQDGDIVLMHDLYSTTADAVEKLVPMLVKKGYQLVTVDELFYYKGIDASDGKVYYSGK